MYLCICDLYLSLETKYSARIQQNNVFYVIVLLVGHLQRLVVRSPKYWIVGKTLV